MTLLSDPCTLRGITLKNRIVVSPMCTYQGAPDGIAKDWHLIHYGRFAMGGAGLVMFEATAISLPGRHGYTDLGIWSDAHVPGLRRITDFLRAQGSVSGLQLQHAGRKASARRAWDGHKPLTEEEDGKLRGEPPWTALAPSAVPYADYANMPAALTVAQIRDEVGVWVDAARRAEAAGFDVLEVHCAHGYLLHQFLSPVSNVRTDEYGGSLANRMRFPLEVVEAVRAVWPAHKPLFVRVSAVDGVTGGWTMDDTLVLARELKACGVDVIDCSSGGIGGPVTNARVPRGPGFQVPFAAQVRRDIDIPTMAVGLITTAEQASAVLREEAADLVAIGREMLVDPNWANHALQQLHPEKGYAHWPYETGWWLDKRDESIAYTRALEEAERRAR